MRFLADTNLFSQRGAYAWMSQHQGAIAVSSLTLAEMRNGIERLAPGPKRRKLDADLADLMEFHVILPFGPLEAFAWGRYTAAHRPLPIMDSLIAATAIAQGLVVATHNASDFPGVDTFDPLS